MAKSKKLAKLGIAAAVGSVAIVAPVATQAAEVALDPAKVAFNVDGQVKIISAEQYILAMMGTEPTILAAITNEAGTVGTPTAVFIGEKYISAEAYILAYMSGTAVTQDEIDAAEKAPIDGALELVDGEWKEVDQTPEENSNETFFYNLAA
ncbi:hypothetical protein [Solibacillus sp. FSL K6-1554]|uniref:hypothetical protein n=1 Tax=Solibacillus sp. FSL K6-1554 TaxID=2921472 RepID=UPI0030FA3927